MSLITEIADAVAHELNTANASTFSQSFTAQRSVLPLFDLEDLKELKVTVVPKSVEINGSTRSVSQYDITVDIGIQRKLSNSSTVDAQVESLGMLVDEIAEYLRQRKLTSAAFAAWVSSTNDPVYAVEHLAEKRVFTSVLTVTYRAMK
ncbi:hypothetical protein KS4_10870 [Poriferisphaera corsica]|uniref:DUF3168 domain-containing protein n=1 Tax=Poriferisphaera corsica TaxID=2528020 RepID=A0A517YS62_9BACT|nr:hypothetical protein [Poriferisphaera corsica]QDU33046.1 hypothetical protein KS4_10870 [Poriferisphaera corsica]